MSLLNASSGSPFGALPNLAELVAQLEDLRIRFQMQRSLQTPQFVHKIKQDLVEEKRPGKLPLF